MRLPVSLVVALALTAGCITERIPAGDDEGRGQSIVIITGLARILRIWSGGYPSSAFGRLPAEVRETPVGYVADPDTFEAVWEAFQPGLPAPVVNFEQELILVARNTDVYSPLSIIQVAVDEGVAQPVVRQAEASRPVTDMVAMSMVLVPRSGIIAIKSDGAVIPLPGTPGQ
jgi:hypothetical protein